MIIGLSLKERFFRQNILLCVLPEHMSPGELREHVKKLFKNKVERLELDLSHSSSNILVWKIRRLENDVINKNMVDITDKFDGCKVDQTEISTSIVDFLKTTSGIYGTVGFIIGIILTTLRIFDTWSP